MTLAQLVAAGHLMVRKSDWPPGAYLQLEVMAGYTSSEATYHTRDKPPQRVSVLEMAEDGDWEPVAPTIH